VKPPAAMWRLVRNSGLSVVLFALFLVFLAGQSLAGLRQYNDDQREHERRTVSYGEYLRSKAFLEATAENWESEFLQMAAFVVLSVRLYQKGSAHSKDPDKGDEAVDRAPDPERRDAPGAVRRGGLALALYRHSLSLALFMLFLTSFLLHAVGGAGEYNEEQAEHGRPERVTVLQYVGTSRFWFESFQNWQSEFLAIFSIVVLSIFLRQQGSPESKPVDSPHVETGND
jgi:hypothetical protein